MPRRYLAIRLEPQDEWIVLQAGGSRPIVYGPFPNEAIAVHLRDLIALDAEHHERVTVEPLVPMRLGTMADVPRSRP